MVLNLSVDEVLTTTRSVRKRLDLHKPVPRQVLVECLDLALQAPTGSNSQGWQWLFVEDADKKKALADLYNAVAIPYIDALPEAPYGDVRDERMGRIVSSARYLCDHLHEVPVLLIPCIEGRQEDLDLPAASFWGGLLPAVWSFMLALRSRGLGSAWTTFHLVGDGEKQAAEMLGIPYERYSQAGLFPVAYTKGTNFRPAKRLPAANFMHWDTW